MKDQLGGVFHVASINFPECSCLLLLPVTHHIQQHQEHPGKDVGRHLLDLVKSMTDTCTLPEKKVTTCEVTSESLKIVTMMRTWSSGGPHLSLLL